MSATEMERKTYKKSFLKNIQSAFSFETVSWTTGLKESLSGFLTSVGFDVKDTGEAAIVQGSRNSITVVVTDGGVVLSMELKDYVSFENYMAVLSSIFDVFKILGCDIVKSFIFQKLNLYKIGFSNTKPAKEDIFKALFSEEVRNCQPALTFTEQDYFYIAQPDYKEFDDHVVAKLLISSMRVSPINVAELLDEMKLVNDKVFNVWYNATTDGVKKIMDK